MRFNYKKRVNRFNTGISNDSTSLDITPMIDIIFLILVFFMVAATFELNRSLKIKLPKSVLSESSLSSDTLLIELNSDGDLFINGQQTYTDELTGLIKSEENYDKKNYILLADELTPYKSVVEIIDKLKILGINEINIGTEK